MTGNTVFLRNDDGSRTILRNISDDSLPTWINAFYRTDKVICIVIRDCVFLDRDEVDL